MNKSLTLSPDQQRRQLALADEASAHTALTTVVTSLADYRDPEGSGPQDGSLKGIMITVSKRVAARYGHKIGEMPASMLRHVRMLKLDLADLVLDLMDRRATYAEMKAEMWALIDRYAEEFQRRGLV